MDELTAVVVRARLDELIDALERLLEYLNQLENKPMIRLAGAYGRIVVQMRDDACALMPKVRRGMQPHLWSSAAFRVGFVAAGVRALADNELVVDKRKTIHTRNDTLARRIALCAHVIDHCVEVIDAATIKTIEHAEALERARKRMRPEPLDADELRAVVQIASALSDTPPFGRVVDHLEAGRYAAAAQAIDGVRERDVDLEQWEWPWLDLLRAAADGLVAMGEGPPAKVLCGGA